MKMNEILRVENVGEFFRNGAVIFEVIEKQAEIIPYSIQFGEDIRNVFNIETICGIEFTKLSSATLGF